VLAAREQISAELRRLQERLASDAARGREQQIEEKIRGLSEELARLDQDFAELAAGVDPRSVELDQPAEDLSLSTEIRELLGPLVNELKRATSRPREIDRLRTEISALQDRIARVDDALARLEQLRSGLTDPIVREAIEQEIRDWQRQRTALNTSLQVAQQKLYQRLEESQSIAQAVENVFQIFFKSRGRNLLLALLAMLAFVLAFRRLRRFMANRPIVSRRAETFEARVFGLVYSAFTVVGAILVFVIALYLFGDWVLLILVLLLILGIIWTSKQAIPRFWSQTVLMLDMGPVREGERVQYNGLPWRIERISFYSILINPVLVGGMIRLPIDDLAHLRSRADREDEPWFPTRENDIVLLEDGRPARVEFQSIDGVRLRVPGENRLIVPAAEFAGQTVERLSDGYRVAITFGLDYGDQAGITTTMRDVLQHGVETRWRETRWADSTKSISVEFKEAGPSSLDLFVRVDLDGSQAFEYAVQKRRLASFCVDVCNEQGWTIPFTQLTLHVAPPAGGAASPARAGEAPDARA
jgi:predicted  nucleic acid-binding Zn-ribbon protein